MSTYAKQRHELLLITWKSDLSNRIKQDFFQVVRVLILLYGCTILILTKHMEKKVDGNYSRMLHAILKKSWKQHPIKQQLYRHLPPISQTIQVRWTRCLGHCWRSKDELIIGVLLWTLTHCLTSIDSVWTLNAIQMTCQKWWMIVTDERESVCVISVTWWW